ncbi:MAG TPA: hypothetical protein VJN94_09640 [Candidatus Binataceae bacterium]|nr:hypothetical protein [Candidatus Binataceae bacterium]
MRITLDHDLATVAEFMMRTVPTDKLRAVAISLVQLADLLWTQFPTDPQFKPFTIYRESGPGIVTNESVELRKPPTATEASQGDSADLGEGAICSDRASNKSGCQAENRLP